MELLTIPIVYKENYPVTFYTVTDDHEGHAGHDDIAAKRMVKIIEEDEKAHWFHLGDEIDCRPHSHKFFNPSEMSNRYGIRDMSTLPMAQAKQYMEMMKPINDKCLFRLVGNHTSKFKQFYHFDVTQYIADTMGHPLLGGRAYVNLAFHREGKTKIDHVVRLSLMHGTGSCGKTPGAAINKVVSTFKSDLADVHFMGHCHRLVKHTGIKREYSYGVFKEIPVYYGMAGCLFNRIIEGVDGYFEQADTDDTVKGFIKTSFTFGRNKLERRIEMQTIEL